jgi:hypothetical protein
MNVINFIFRLLHIHNLPTLPILIPFHLPCTPSIDYAHLFTNCENTSSDCINFLNDYAHNSDDCVNTLDDLVNNVANLTDMSDISSLDLYIPNPTLLQLLFIYKSKIKTMFTIGSMIYSLFPTFFIHGFVFHILHRPLLC